ncbi:DUF371 domain-containing protein [Haloarchaeobius sp. DYHT-AS-18]|uniref:DUF371 domain-containing protein n=1 Tax=Haloarchaeobius sp. DYHT-AS-18 TaxID=3446117 RepID=UPI003EB85426
MQEVIHARGHENVSAEHTSTFEVTTDDYLTPAGDCILAIDADRSPADFDPEFVELCQTQGARITFTIEAGGYSDSVTGLGHPSLEFTNDRSMVGRTSDYVDDRTIMLAAPFAAEGFDRDLVAALAEGAEVTVTLEVDA